MIGSPARAFPASKIAAEAVSRLLMTHVLHNGVSASSPKLPLDNQERTHFTVTQNSIIPTQGAGTLASRISNGCARSSPSLPDEIAHEALARRWSRLRQWPEEDREILV